MVSLDRRSGIPLHIQIREVLRQEFLSDTWQPQMKLPSEQELAHKYGVSRMTVRQAINHLFQEGYLYRKHGVGTFVSTVKPLELINKPLGYNALMISRGKKPSSRLLSISTLHPTLEVRNALQLDEGEEVDSIKRIRFADDEPCCIDISFIPHHLVPFNWQAWSWDNQSLASLLARQGMPIVRTMEQVTIKPADVDEADILMVPVGAALLKLEMISFIADGKPLLFTTAVINAEVGPYDVMRTR